MDKKFLVGFEVYASSVMDVMDKALISFALLQSLRDISVQYYDVSHIKYIEREKIQIYCRTEMMEVPLLSRGKDKLTKSLLEDATKKYSKVLENIDPRSFWYTINPLYFTFSKGEILIYRQCHWGVEKDMGLSNTILYFDCYSKFQKEVDMYMKEKDLKK